MADQVSFFTLDNGLKVVHQRRDSKAGICGVAVGAGSRDDPGDKLGLAHFVEHTIFKGTAKRKAWHILNRMERVGGELNAYTTKEETVVYSAFPGEHFGRAAELIADLVQNSQFPAAPLARERDVVLEEASSYLDTPAEAVYDDFEDLIWAESGLGHNILGMEAHLASIDGDDCRRHLHSLFTPDNMVLFALGPMSPDSVLTTARKLFGEMTSSLQRRPRTAPAPVQPFSRARQIGSHQAHTIYGAPAFSMRDPMKYPMSLLCNMLGGPGMNSLLNVAIREKRGYAYSVEANMAALSDCGLLTVYFGSDQEHVRRCLQIIGRTITSLAEKPLTHRALDAAKKQLIGQLRLADDNSETRALAIAKSALHFGRVEPDAETEARIGDVTPQQIMDAAAAIAPANASILTLR